MHTCNPKVDTGGSKLQSYLPLHSKFRVTLCACACLTLGSVAGSHLHFQSSLSSLPESVDNCPSNCYGNGDCISGTCHCFLGFLGPDCGRGKHSHEHSCNCFPDPVASWGALLKWNFGLTLPPHVPGSTTSAILQWPVKGSWQVEPGPISLCYPAMDNIHTQIRTGSTVFLAGVQRVAVRDPLRS